MSEIMVSKTHIDALLTAALRWSDPADPYGPLGAFTFYREEELPDSGVSGTSVYLTADNAHDLGRARWLFHFDMCDWEEGRDEAEAYAFEVLPGDPDPVVILRGIEFDGYRTRPESVEEWSETSACKHCFPTRVADDAHLRIRGGAAMCRQTLVCRHSPDGGCWFEPCW